RRAAVATGAAANGVRLVGAAATGAAAFGAIAAGAVAASVVAIGALAIGRLAVGAGHVRRLRIDELTIGRLNGRGLDLGGEAIPTPAAAPVVPAGAARARPDAKRLFLEDLAVGQRWQSGTLTVGADAIKAFAAAFDPQPFHLDEREAAATLFGGLAASGWHTAALTMRLLTEGGLPIAGGIIGTGGEIAWPRPTRPDDVLRVESEVLEVTPSRSRPDRGVATVRSTTLNQRGDVVQTLTAKLVVPRRPTVARDWRDQEGDGKALGYPCRFP
ncbi:MAG TPA: MaoC/PaaZ C-terminal domain-containing protein, partial [Acetobacteraceae bacterium]|nr:MaoC/PaaZ C-terminal domain-containing protein [Acetobacteraceae bacterium]